MVNGLLDFKVFCFEAYRSQHNLTGVQAINLFNKYGVFDYLTEFYDVLHTTGREYLIKDLDEFIAHRK